MGSIHLMEAVRRAGIRAALVMVTTDKVYRNREWSYGYREDDALGGHDPYSASKAALNSLTRSLAAKLDRPLAVLSLHPGWVRTDMGGGSAPLDVETSARGLVDTILAHRNEPGSAFYDYSGAALPW